MLKRKNWSLISIITENSKWTKGKIWPVMSVNWLLFQPLNEYASISHSIPKYPWKSLNKLFWPCQGSEYAWSSYMFDRLLEMPRILNMPGFWIRHDCIWKGYTKFWICLNMAQSASIMPEYASICLNVLQCAWTSVNIAGCLWICMKVPE